MQICRTLGNDAEAATPVLWPPHAKSWLVGKDSDAGRDWGQEKGTTEDEMAGWHHQLDGREFEWPPGVGDGQGGLACCNSWGRTESDTTEWLNWLNWYCLYLTENNHFSLEFTLVFKIPTFDSHQMNNWQSGDCKIKGVQRSQDNIKLRNLK